jgi:hypothetical protein
MLQLEQGVLDTPQKHRINSIIMEWASDHATELTEKYCEKKSIKCWEHEGGDEEEQEQRFTEEAQEIFNQYYDDQMTSFYVFANDLVEAFEEPEKEDKRTYFLFGETATDILDRNGEEALLKWVKDNDSNYQTAFYTDSDSDPASLLAEYEGWNGYMTTSKELYEKLQEA